MLYFTHQRLKLCIKGYLRQRDLVPIIFSLAKWRQILSPLWQNKRLLIVTELQIDETPTSSITCQTSLYFVYSLFFSQCKDKFSTNWTIIKAYMVRLGLEPRLLIKTWCLLGNFWRYWEQDFPQKSVKIFLYFMY